MEDADFVGQTLYPGVDQKEVMVEVDQERMAARGVKMSELVSTLRSDNFALAGGYVREGSKKFYVRSMARYSTIQEIENIKDRHRGSSLISMHLGPHKYIYWSVTPGD